MKTLKMAACAAVVVAASAAMAATITTKQGNTSRWESMFTEAIGSNTASDWFGKAYYSDGLAPHADADYSGDLMGPAHTTTASNHVFVGKSFTINHFSLYAHTPNTHEFAQDGLIMKAGCDMRERNQTSDTYIIRGNVLVKGTASSPSQICGTINSPTMTARPVYVFTNGTFRTENADSVLRLRFYNNVEQPGTCDVWLKGDTSGFTGTIQCQSTRTNHLVFAAADAMTFPGKVRMLYPACVEAQQSVTMGAITSDVEGGAITVGGGKTLTVGDLTLPGGTIDVTCDFRDLQDDMIKVTGTASITKPVALHVFMTGFNSIMNTANKNKIGLVRVPKASAAALAQITADAYNKANRFTYPIYTFTTEEDGDDMVLFLNLTPVNKDLKSKNNDDVGWRTNTAYWSAGRLPQANDVCWVPSLSSDFADENSTKEKISYPETWNYWTNDVAKTLHWVFDGCGLAWRSRVFEAATMEFICSGKELACYGGGYEGTFFGKTFKKIEEIRVPGGIYVNANNTSTCISFRPYQDVFLWLNANISGDGAMQFRQRGAFHLGGYTYLSGDNSNFTGEMWTNDFAEPDAGYDTSASATKIAFSDIKNLGGERKSFDAVALKLVGHNALYPLCDVTLDTLTRGIAFRGMTYILMDADTTLTVKQAMTIRGKVIMEGKGKLVLASAEAQKLGFFNENIARGDTPFADYNLFDVTNGYLKVTSKWAADGFALTFKKNGKLLVGLNQTADTAYYNVKGTTASDASDGKIPVAFESPVAGKEAMDYQAVLATSKSQLSFNVAERPRGYGIKIEESTDESGNYVYTATVAKKGLLIFIR